MASAWSLRPQSCRCDVIRMRWRLAVRPSARHAVAAHAQRAGSSSGHSCCAGGLQRQSQQQQRHSRCYTAPRDVRALATPNRTIIEEAIALTRDEKRDKAYREGAAFLRSLDITSQTELTRVLDIAMNPNSLFADHQNKLRASNASARLLTVEEDLKPVVEYFGSLGLDAAQIKQVVLEHPPVLSYSPTQRLAPFIEGLAELGVTDPLKVIVRRPSLLGLSLRDNVQRIVAYLLEAGHSMAEVEEMLATTI